MAKTDDVKRFLNNLDGELNGAALYDALAESEKDQKLAEVYRRLASVERKHSQKWVAKLEEAGAKVPAFKPSFRTRILALIARRFGVRAVLPSVVAFENVDGGGYAKQPDAHDLVADERSHARLLKVINRTVTGGLEGSSLAALEGRHKSTGGNALRAAVLGANDGLVSNLSLVMGVSGAALSSQTVLLTGLAGLLAGAGSMALGEWLSVQSSRELYINQLESEAEEIEAAPEEEVEELSLIYQSRGLSESQARMMASQIMSNPETALQTLAREELGIDPDELGGSAWQAAFTSFFLFAMGAIVPVLPFFFTSGLVAVAWSAGLSTIALFTVGAAITLFTGRGVLFSGGRQVLFGLIAAVLTFGLGRLLGVSMS